MTQKRNINKRKLWQFLIAAVLLCVIVPVLFMAITSNREGYIDKIELKYLNDKHIYISHESIIDLMSTINQKDIYETPIKDIDVQKLEDELNAHPWVKKAEVYLNKSRKIVVEILQNQPIARVFYQNNKTVYYDSTGVELPIDYVYPLPIPVFTNVAVLKDDHKSEELKKNILNFSKVINADTFWNAQITQINMSFNHEFDVTTVMGDFVVRFGHDSDYKEKLNNLHVFFNQGLAKLGWDTYDLIDMRYNNQIVTSPALDYIAPPPSDTAITVPNVEEPIEIENSISDQVDTASA